MDADERAAQLYTLEYEKAAERYENVYRSMWTIFSYLTAIAAGLLAFGADRIEPHALICFAALPLIFWFWTTYLPLDRYGNGAVARLAQLERLLNNRFNIQLSHFSGFAHPLRVSAGLVRAFLNPYADLPNLPKPSGAGIRHRIWATLTAVWYQLRRARSAIFVFFAVLHIVVYYQATLAWKAHKAGQPLFRERAESRTADAAASGPRRGPEGLTFALDSPTLGMSQQVANVDQC